MQGAENVKRPVQGDLRVAKRRPHGGCTCKSTAVPVHLKQRGGDGGREVAPCPCPQDVRCVVGKSQASWNTDALSAPPPHTAGPAATMTLTDEPGAA